MHDADMTRRSLIAAGAFGAVAGLAATASAAEAPAQATAEEQTNLKVVKAFIATWSKKGYDPDKVMAQYIAADGKVRFMQTMPFIEGPAAVAEGMKSFTKNGESFSVVTHWARAHGPLVITDRTDTMITPGKPDQSAPVVGVFLLADGKIKEWTDFVVGPMG